MRIQQVGLWRMDVRDAVEPCFSENGQVQSRLDCTDKMTTLSTPLHPAILACCAKVSSASHTLSLSLSLFLTLPVLGSSGSCVSSFCDHMLKPGEHSFAQETLKAWQLGEQFLRLTPKKMEVLLDSWQIYCWIPCFFFWKYVVLSSFPCTWKAKKGVIRFDWVGRASRKDTWFSTTFCFLLAIVSVGFFRTVYWGTITWGRFAELRRCWQPLNHLLYRICM